MYTKQMYAGLALFIVLTLLLPIGIGLVTESESEVVFVFSKKIEPLLADQMIRTDADETLDVIVATRENLEFNSKLRLEAQVGKLDVKRTFTIVPALEIHATPAQIEALAEEHMVMSLEWGNRQGELSLDQAQIYTNTDELRDPSGYDVDGTGITVAVVDSGIWTGHEQIDAGKMLAFKDIWGEANGSEYSDFTSPIVGIDVSFVGHGTAMEAIIAGSGIGNPDLNGVAPEVNLVGVRWTTGWWGYLEYVNALAAFNWVGENAETYGIDILSFSAGFYRSITDRDYYYGSGVYSDTLTRAADELFTQYGVIVVSSAGNSGVNKVVKSPSSGKYVICVGSVADPSEGGWSLMYEDDDDGSSIGPVNYLDDNLTANPDWYKPDVVAPGVDIETAGWGNSGNPKAYNSYRDDWTGTSPATAFVSGLIALYLDYDGNLALDLDSDGNPDVKQLLWASAVEINTPVDGVTPAAGIDKYYGAGRVDGVAGLDFYTTDVSTSKGGAKHISDPYHRYNEPMWRRDLTNNEDWYRLSISSSMHITIFVYSDPDLMVQVTLYRYSSQKGQDASTSRGDDCSISYTGSAGYYYIKIKLTGSYGTMGYPGDYYDIHVYTASA